LCLCSFLVCLITLFSYTGHIASNDRMIVNAELEKRWNEAVKYYKSIYLETEENHEPSG